jgi:hypothetical protein
VTLDLGTATVDAWRMPASLRPFVGRDPELTELMRALGEARDGLGSLWLVGGEPGIGKSRLAEEVARAAAAEGTDVLWGRCWEAGGAPAYWPWVQVLRQLLRGLSTDDIRALVAPWAPHLVQLTPELGGVFPNLPPGGTLEPEQARFQLFEAVASLLCDAAARRARLILLDDLHAADLSSLQLLSMVASTTASAHLVVVGTYREREAQGTALGGMLPALVRQARTIALPRLRPEDVQRFLEQATDTLDAGTADAAHRLTEGHPLFLVELARWLDQAGAGAELLREGSPTLPRNVRDAIRERIARLGTDAVEVLRLASVLGREVDLPLLRWMCDRPEAQVQDALTQASMVSVVHELERERWRFTHILIRETLYWDLPEEARIEAHLRAAAALERLHAHRSDPPWSELAHQYFAAGERGREKAIAAATHAGDQALEQFAFTEAAAWFRRALEALASDAGSSPVRRYELLLRLGRALMHQGELTAGRARCAEAAEVARRLGDAELLARAALAQGATYVYASVDPALVAVLSEARDALGDRERGLLARVLARLAAALQPASDVSMPMAMARRAVDMARRAGDERTLLATLRDAVSTMMDLADPAERLALNREHIALARRLGEPVEVWRGHLRTVFDLIEMGETAAVLEAVEATATAARALGHPHYAWQVAGLRAMVAIHDRQWDAADRWSAEAATLAERSGDPNAHRTIVLQRAHRLSVEGRSEELLALLPAVRASLAGLDAHGEQLFSRAVVAGHLARGGRPGDARRYMDDVTIDRVLAASDTSLFSALADVCLASGDRPLAERLIHRLRPLRGCHVSGGIFEMVWGDPVDDILARLEAMLGGAPEARPSPAPTVRLTLRREGDHWVVGQGDVVFHLRDVKGLHMLARLTSEPGRELHVLDLSHTPDAQEGAPDRGDAGEVLDERARAEYGRRLRELTEDLQEAEDHHDTGRAERLRGELAFLEAELSRAVGLGGRARRVGAAAERARVNVQRRLRDAVRRIGEHDPALARHLERSLRTGTFCMYDPA